MPNHTRRQKEILKCLLSKNKTYTELKGELKYNDTTLTRHLNILIKGKYIEHVNKNYCMKVKGLDFLYELDPETKGKVFTHDVFRDIELFINFTHFNHPDCFKEKFFYESLEKRIGEAVLFITLKFMEDGRLETSKFLSNLPLFIASILKRPEISYREIIPLIADKTLINRLSSHYKRSQEMTPEGYKELIVLNNLLKEKT